MPKNKNDSLKLWHDFIQPEFGFKRVRVVSSNWNFPKNYDEIHFSYCESCLLDFEEPTISWSMNSFQENYYSFKLNLLKLNQNIYFFVKTLLHFS